MSTHPREWHEVAGLTFSATSASDWAVTPVVLTEYMHALLESGDAIFTDKISAEVLQKRIGNPFPESE